MANIPGDEKDNLLTGGVDGDTIQAQEGNDTLRGRGGNDTLLGGTGEDIMRGQKGDDVMRDGFGVDRLKGGRGADIFEFVRAEAPAGKEKDVVKDFTDGTDLLSLQLISNDLSGILIEDTRGGDVRITLGNRVILLVDRDGTLDAADITLADFL